MWNVPRLIALVLLASVATSGTAWADSVRLTNGDTLVGKVVSLDENQLVLQSENFGEMTIPRKKIQIIGLGETPLAQMLGTGRPAGPSAAGEMPSLQSPQVRQQLDQLLQQALGGGGLGDMRQQMQSTRRGLQDLQRDLGPGSSADALEGYIQMFEMFGGGAAAEPAEPPAQQRGANRPQGSEN